MLAPENLKCWPSGTGYALADWLTSKGLKPEFIDWPKPKEPTPETND
jgi:hypothetical protein